MTEESLPPGQVRTRKWPVLDLGDQPEIPRETWSLEVTGAVEHPRRWTWAELQELPAVEATGDFHCVTGWSRLGNRWAGVRLRDLAALAEPRPEVRFLLARGADRDPASGEPYTADLPLEEALREEVLLVHTWDGAPLPGEHGGPVRLVVPRLYAWKSVKWVTGLDFSAEDRPGYWERRGYSRRARPWLEERYAR